MCIRDSQEAWGFLNECRRVLMNGGTLRIAFPDVSKMTELFQLGGESALAYMKAASKDGTEVGAVKAAIFNHGHQAAWCAELMTVFLRYAGFASIMYCVPTGSGNPDLQDIEQHWKSVGHEINDFETSVIEAIK